jgi:branched-subunit amino acid aminotransferase/4-amino-4-deoxychorismate lyase
VPRFKGLFVSEKANRAFLYGESVFTTMRMQDSKVLYWPEHFERLRKGAEFIYGPFPEKSWESDLENRLQEQMARQQGNCILRLTIYLDQEHRSLRPTTIKSISSLSMHLLSEPIQKVSSMGDLKLRSAPAPVKPEWWPSSLKCGQYLETILARKVFLREGDDDLLFVSERGMITETSIANVFMIKDGVLKTPPPGPQVLEGISRKIILGRCSDLFRRCEERSFSVEDLVNADAAFITNSVYGLRVISAVDEKVIKTSNEMILSLSTLRERVLS